MTSLVAVQKALKDAGFDPGPIDGIWGPRTRAAVVAFQRARGLIADGIVGPQTRAALFKAPQGTSQASRRTLPVDLPWLHEAVRLIGVAEAPGAANNPIIISWAQNLGLGAYTDDEIPWCGLFVAHCIRTGLPNAILPPNVLAARAWQRFGNKCQPQLGAVLVFWRHSIADWRGHVGFYWAEDRQAFHVLGGNQSDSVTIQRIARNRLLDARWPDGVAETNIVRHAQPDGHLSINEQ